MTASQHETPNRGEPVAYDAVVFVSFGGPESPEEVIPFLERVTAGRNIPKERLALVGQHYFDRGGVSPINAQCRDMIDRLRVAFVEEGIDMPIYWGNRNSEPFLDDTLSQMARDGIERGLAFVTSAYSSYSGCRQYRENIAQACQAAGSNAPTIDKLRVYFNHPGFIDPLAEGLKTALDGLDRERTQVLFTAHSIPTSMAEASFYVEQLHSAVELVISQVGRVRAHGLVWQSRSGPPSVPWLEPDIVDAIAALEPSEFNSVVVVPIGFVSDHMEVIQDLDTDAAAAAAEAGLSFDRVRTSSSDPRFIDMIVDLVRERTEGVTPKALGPLGLVPAQCQSTCCPAPKRRPTGSRPSAGR